MKTKRPEIKTNKYDLVLILLISTIVIGIVILIFSTDQKPRTEIRTEHGKSLEYKSEQMRMSLFIPANLEVKEAPNRITLNNETGTLTVARIATNFDTVQDYFDLLKDQNSYEDYKATPLTINGIDTLLVELVSNDGQKNRIYFMYIDHWIYTISTSHTEFYTYQDAMVDSFNYVP